MRRVIVVVDMEGAAGIGNVKECFPWYPEYHKHGVVQLAGDVNAAVRGLRAAGIDDIIICDMHFMGQNLSESQLEPHIKLVHGRLHNLRNFLEEGCDGVILLCFHAMAGTPNGFMSHTVIPFLRVRVNGQLVGETAVISWLCGTYDVPTVMVTGDEICIEEAQEFLSGVATVAVKKAKNRKLAQCYPVEEVRRLIERTATATAQRLDKHRVHHVQEAVLIEMGFRTADEADSAAAVPKARKTSSRVVAYKSKKYSEAFDFLSVAKDRIESSWLSEVMQKLTATDEGKRIFKEWNHQFTEQWMREPQLPWYE